MCLALSLLGPVPALAAEPVRILMLGDSLTAGFGLIKGQSIVVRLEAALERDGLAVSVINAGVSGDTTAGGRARLAWALADRPDALIVELGANDGLRGLDPADTKANLDAILAEALGSGIPVLLAGMRAPPNLGPEYGSEFDAVYPDLARKHGVDLYPFFLDGVAAEPDLNQEDGIHPNEKGVAVIVERFLPYVKRLAARVKR